MTTPAAEQTPHRQHSSSEPSELVSALALKLAVSVYLASNRQLSLLTACSTDTLSVLHRASLAQAAANDHMMTSLTQTVIEGGVYQHPSLINVVKLLPPEPVSILRWFLLLASVTYKYS